MIRGTTLLAAKTATFPGAYTPAALYRRQRVSGYSGLPFPPALGGPFAAPLFAPLSAPGTLCGCACSVTSASTVWMLEVLNHIFVRLSSTIFRILRTNRGLSHSQQTPANFSLSGSLQWNLSPRWGDSGKAANASPGGKLSKIGTSEPIFD